jgi:predicted kinase
LRDNTVVVIFFGLIAAGKSVLASSWAAHHRCPCHNTDVVRKQLAGSSPHTSHRSALGSGIYTTEFTDLTYRTLCSHAIEDLRGGKNGCVVLDGSYRRESDRSFLTETLGQYAEVLFIYCYCSEQTTRKRLRQRAEDTMAVSDGTWGIYIRQREDFSVPDDIDGAHLLHLNTERPLAELLASVDTFVTEVHAAIEKKTQAEKP